MAVSIQLAGASLYEREDSVVRLERGSARTQCARAEFGGVRWTVVGFRATIKRASRKSKIRDEMFHFIYTEPLYLHRR
jgi:hypothetical protein